MPLTSHNENKYGMFTTLVLAFDKLTASIHRIKQAPWGFSVEMNWYTLRPLVEWYKVVRNIVERLPKVHFDARCFHKICTLLEETEKIRSGNVGLTLKLFFHSDEPVYPHLKSLLQFDTREFFNVLALAFEEPEFNSPDGWVTKYMSAFKEC